MKIHIRNETGIILTYFLSFIFTGTLLLLIPAAWKGDNDLKIIDAFFTASSAVCVTGLITVDTALFSRFGQSVILFLIQFGGLGLISFSSFYLVIPSRKPTIKGSRIIREYYLDSIEYEPVDIVKQILLMTFSMEIAGAAVLFFQFRAAGSDSPFFTAVFHSVSAFCNAGFSTFSSSFESYNNNAVVNITVMLLIISGGIGFVVFRDIVKTIIKKHRHFTVHTKIVMLSSLILILYGAAVIFMVESNNILSGSSLKNKILVSLFQSVTSRTAGFNTVPIHELNIISQMTLIPLMFIGGAPGSIAGGIKVTTFFIILMIIIRQMDERRNITVFSRVISTAVIFKALVYLIKALTIITAGIIVFSAAELHFNHVSQFSIIEMVFECFSAFGTVGLSMGITQYLSVPGKFIIIMIMFTGRFGLLIIVINLFGRKRQYKYDYPNENVLIG